MAAIDIDRQPSFGEWHVSKRPTNGDSTTDPDDLLFAIHYMLDPGDGLCSTVIDFVPRAMAEHLVEIHNRWLENG